MGNVLTKCNLLVQVQEWWPQGLMSTTLSLNMELPTSLGRHFARELTHSLISLILIIVNLLKRPHLNGWNVCQHLEHCTMVFVWNSFGTSTDQMLVVSKFSSTNSTNVQL